MKLNCITKMYLSKRNFNFFNIAKKTRKVLSKTRRYYLTGGYYLKNKKVII